jgi:hypothetical protein
VIWLQAFGGLLLVLASFLVIGAVILADGTRAAPVVRRRRGKPVDLRRAA